MISRMAFFDGDEGAATGCTNFVVCDQFGFDRRSILLRINNMSSELNFSVTRRRSQQPHMEISRDGAIGLVFAVALHQKVGRRPVRVTIEQRADDAAIQHTGKCLMMRLGVPLRDNFVTGRKTVHVQTLFIRRPAAEANAVWRILLLKR